MDFTDKFMEYFFDHSREMERQEQIKGDPDTVERQVIGLIEMMEGKNESIVRN